MKKYLILALSAVAISSCKNEQNEEITVAETPELYMQVAQNSGIDQWNDVEELDFTFNVERNGEVLSSRKWEWNPKTNEVTLISKKDTINYNRSQPLDSLSLSADRAFVNDIFWLLPQYKLVWDEGKEITYPESTDGKVVKVQYTGNDGYTPGDRYDMVIGDDNNINKWMYYPKGAQEPAMTTTFEDYKDYNGIKIATNHRSLDKTLNIFFTDISVTK